MKFDVKCFFLASILISLIYWFVSSSSESTLLNRIGHHQRLRKSNKDEIVIAVVSCGDRTLETLNMIKSALISNTDHRILKFVIVTEIELFDHFHEKLQEWQIAVHFIFTYEIYPLTFPKKDEHEWKKLFKPCASQRLFLPNLLKHIDSILYLDSDVIFTSQPSEIWQFFKQFNESQVAGVAPESEDRNAGWYNRFARHPFYGELGINSGVMLMNLTRMRAPDFKWEDEIMEIYKEYKLFLVWGDQDIINILFFYNSEKLFIFPCEWNYRADHCMYMDICSAPDGIKLLHGNRGYFHNQAQPVFNYFYSAIEEYQFKTDPYKNIIKNIEFQLSVQTSNCDKIFEKFLISPRRLFPKDNYDVATSESNNLNDDQKY